MPGNIQEALQNIEQGKFVIVVDEADDYNTGDLIIGAEFADAAAINYMMTRGRGMLCVALTGQRLDELDIPPMAGGDPRERITEQGRSGPGFTVSVDAAEGIVSGDTAGDRARTIQLLICEDTRPADVVRPGHVFPIRAAEGGTLARVRHTEAAVDLARLAGLYPAGVLCQILSPDGTVADMEALQEFAEADGLQIVTIADIIRLRRRTERLVAREAAAHLPTIHGDFEAIIYTSRLGEDVYIAITRGDLRSCEAPLVRVHSGCVTGDVLGSLKCDCGWQLHAALKAIEEAGCGVVIYIPSHEGRGIGLANKIKAYHLQENGYDTVEANEALGFPADMRDYGLGAQVLADLGITKMRLMTNNPAKYTAMDGYGLEVVERIPLEAPATPYSAEYLRTKREKMGHLLGERQLCSGDDRKTLRTWAKRSAFQYSGSVAEGTIIHYGHDYCFTAKVSAEQYAALLGLFGGRTVSIGTSRDKPPTGSMGEWLQHNVTRVAIASYVGAILVSEGYADRIEGSRIRFFD